MLPLNIVLPCRVNACPSFALVTESSISDVVPTEFDVGVLILVCVKHNASTAEEFGGAVENASVVPDVE